MARQPRSDKLAHETAQRLSREPDMGFCIITMDSTGREGHEATCLTNIPPAVLVPILLARAEAFSDGEIGQVFYQQNRPKGSK